MVVIHISLGLKGLCKILNRYANLVCVRDMLNGCLRISGGISQYNFRHTYVIYQYWLICKPSLLNVLAGMIIFFAMKKLQTI